MLPDHLKPCWTEKKCDDNDETIFPMMRYYVVDEGYSEREAAKLVAKEYDGKVTAERARQVYIRRGGSHEPQKSNDETKSITYESQEGSTTHPPTNRGGKRDKAGRPRKGVELTVKNKSNAKNEVKSPNELFKDLEQHMIKAKKIGYKLRKCDEWDFEYREKIIGRLNELIRALGC